MKSTGQKNLKTAIIVAQNRKPKNVKLRKPVSAQVNKTENLQFESAKTEKLNQKWPGLEKRKF